MNRFLLILILMMLTSALSAENSFVKIKTILKKDIYYTKLLVRHPMIDKLEAERNRKEVQYIRHIVADIDDQVVFDVWTSPLVSKNPIFKFKFKYFGKSKTINTRVLDNFNKLDKRSFHLNDRNFTAIKESSSLRPKGLNEFPNKVWKTTTVDEGIKELYGVPTKFEKGIVVTGPNFIISDYSRITIKSKVDLESIAIYAKGYSGESLRAIFIIPKNGIIDYDFPIKITASECGKNTKITVVGKDRNNTMYKTTSRIQYCRCSHGCGEDGV